MTSPLALVRRLFARADIEGVQYDYQPEVDLFFAWIGEPRAARNVEVENGVYLRVLEEDKRIVGIEVLDCASRFGVEPGEIDQAFAKQLLRRYATRRSSSPRRATAQPSLG